jgi:phosphatidylinositol alpha-1,6-mannosyltransferase
VFACRAKTPKAFDERKRLQRRAQERGLEPRTHWIGETPKIQILLGLADVVLFPSNNLFAKMDYPLVVLEAMALRRPVVLTPGTSVGELHELGGVVLVPMDRDAIAAELRRLLDDATGRDRLGSAARGTIETHFSIDMMAERYELLYDELA